VRRERTSLRGCERETPKLGETVFFSTIDGEDVELAGESLVRGYWIKPKANTSGRLLQKKINSELPTALELICLRHPHQALEVIKQAVTD
jgi:hypothetical protein